MNYQYVWMLIGVLFILFDVGLGSVYLLAFGASCLMLSAITFVLPDLSVPVQVGLLGVIAAVVTPILVLVIKPMMVRKQDPVGLAGSPSNFGKSFFTVVRDYDQATCIEINRNLYRCELEDGRAPCPSQDVTLVGFKGTVAQVFINSK